MLPRATRYLVHPVLSDVIGRLNPGYLERIDRVDIVGYGRAWRGTPSADRAVTTRTLFVLTGDVKGFGELIRAGVDAGVRQALEEALRKWARETIAAELGAGDTVSVVHDDPVVLAQVARHLMDEVYRAPGQPRLRIALHHGEVQTRRRAIDGTHVDGPGGRPHPVVLLRPGGAGPWRQLDEPYLAGDWGRTLGTLPRAADVSALVTRAQPAAG